MPSLGPLEILVVAVLALVVFGPDRLPDIARTVGRTLSELKRMASEVKTEFESGMNLDEVEDEPEDVTPAPPPSDQEDH
jgi:sec-independent protein translocase protein TatB